jgi:alpha-glutamyl/putrescinyl thymine pyrophosphorylase clade 1
MLKHVSVDLAGQSARSLDDTGAATLLPLRSEPRPSPKTLQVGRRALTVTPVFDTYWRFAYRRQQAFMRRALGALPPWTDDPIIAAHRFTNPYRASDRVSQYLIRHVLYAGEQAPQELFFRAVLFKLFNRVETWTKLTGEFGPIRWRGFSLPKAARVLESMRSRASIYSAAYIMPSPPFGAERKHTNHLRLIEHMMNDGAPAKVAAAASLEEVFRILRSYPSLGDFLAFQLTIDLNYSALVDFSEMDFVVAGPGARDGIRKCFADTAGLTEADIIRLMADVAESEFERLGLPFQDLWGRPLQLIDCQNLFCEVDKYARVAHPEFAGNSGRTRIKQRFNASLRPTPQWYPPKWRIQPPAVERV